MDRRTMSAALEKVNPASEKKTKRGIDRKYFVRDVIDAIWAGESLDAEQERARKDKETADKLAMENALRRGELAELSTVTAAWIDMVAAARAKLLSLPTKLGPQLANIADVGVIAAQIRSEVYAAIDELAADQGAGGGQVENAGGMEVAAGLNGKSVGRRKSPAKQRVERGAGPMAN